VNPRTVSPVGIPAAEAVGRPNGPRFLGFHPFGSPWRRRGLTRQPLAAPLGFTLLRRSSSGLVRDFARTPPTRFADPTARVGSAGAPEYRSTSAWPGPNARQAGRTRQTAPTGFLHLCDTRAFEPAPNPGLFHSPHAAPHIAAGCPTFLWVIEPRSTGVAGRPPEVPSLLNILNARFSSSGFGSPGAQTRGSDRNGTCFN
jgi:hypothetical protein